MDKTLNIVNRNIVPLHSVICRKLKKISKKSNLIVPKFYEFSMSTKWSGIRNISLMRTKTSCHVIYLLQVYEPLTFHAKL